MNTGEHIKRIRLAKGLSQKEVTMTAKIDKSQYSRIENGKTDPSVSTVDKIAKALGVSLSELFANTNEMEDIHSVDKSIMEKVSLIENLNEEEKTSLYFILDAFLGKRKLKDALSSILKDVK